MRTICLLLFVSLGLTAVATAVGRPASRPASPVASRPASSPDPASVGRAVVDRAVAAHGGIDAWRALGDATFIVDTVRNDTAGRPVGPPNRMTITFPTSGEARIEAEMGGMRMRYVEGRTEVVGTDGQPVDDPSAHARAFFMLPTFQYILSLPWKLVDPGARYEGIMAREGMAGGRPGVRVTYAPGVGDTPDDWYRFYVDAETGRLVDVLWIITAPAHPGFIEWCRFEDLRDVEGVLLPHRWIYVPADADGNEIGPPAMIVRLIAVSFSNAGADRPPTSRPAASRPAASQPATSRPASRPASPEAGVGTGGSCCRPAL